MTKAKEPKPPRPKRAGPATPANPTTGSFQVSDELWAVLAPLIPQRVNTHPLGGGRPRVPDRTCANGIFYVLRKWKALDTGPAPPLRWNGWPPGYSVGRDRYDELQGLDWSWLSMMGHWVRPMLGAGPNPTDRGKSGVKLAAVGC